MTSQRFPALRNFFSVAQTALLTEWMTAVGTPLILHGESLDRLSAAAQEISRGVYCADPDTKPCGTCRACRLMAAGSHPDVVWLSADAATLSIAAIRDMISATSRTAFSGQGLVIMPSAERLSHPAANALLKILEEQSSTRFLLTCQRPQQILPTLRSRSVLVRIASDRAAEPPDTIAFEILPLLQQKRDFTEPELAALHRSVEIKLHAGAPAAALRQTMGRLVDYYKVKQRRGNVILAKTILLASLYQLDHTGK